MDSQQFRDAAASSIDEIANYYDGIGSRAVVSAVEPGYLRKLLPTEAPEEGETWAAIQGDVEAKIMPGITHWQHPSFHAFFPCATSYPSILGELYSAALSGACFNWINSPAVTELETIVLDWLAKLLGLPACFLSTGPTHGGGVIQGSASEAVLTAMVAAREKYLRETVPPGLKGDARDDAMAVKRGRMVALASSAAHSSVRKAALVLGLRFVAIPVHADTGFALTGPALRAALRDCRQRGLEPFFLATTLGTTDTCAVDDFAAIADVLAEAVAHAILVQGSEVWVHVDAAYAGAALVCPEVQAATGLVVPAAAGESNANAGNAVLAGFHSFDMNMHKWLLTNFDASCLFVRDRAWFVAALSVNQSVYRNSASDGGLVTDYREWQIPLGRRFRALKIWFVMRSYGASGLRDYIRATTALGEHAATLLRARPDLFEIVAGPRFALTVFRVVARSGHGGKDKDAAAANALTRAVCDKVNASGKMWVTSTVLDGKFAIRLMTAVRTTEKEHVDNAVKWLVAAAEEVVKS